MFDEVASYNSKLEVTLKKNRQPFSNNNNYK